MPPLNEDAAEEHTGGGCASYAALQGAASAWEGQPADLLAAAHALELPAVDVASARNHARREINAEDAIERARRATKKAAALLQATGETSRETSDARPRRQRHALMKFSSSSSTADASTTVELQMPPRLGKIETTQNVQYLKPYRKRPASDGPTTIPPPPQIVDGQPEFVVEDILAVKKVGRTNQYLIRWEGYGVEEDSWVPKLELQRNCQSILDAFNQRQLLRPRRQRRILYVRMD